jgi:hypothetical protein
MVVESSIGLAPEAPLRSGWAFSRGEDVTFNAGGNLISSPEFVEQGDTSIAVRWGNPRLQYNVQADTFAFPPDFFRRDTIISVGPQYSVVDLDIPGSAPSIILTNAERYLADIAEPALITVRGTGHSQMFSRYSVFDKVWLIREATPQNIRTFIDSNLTVGVFEDDCFAIGFDYPGRDNFFRGLTVADTVPPRVYPTFTPVLDLLTWKVKRDEEGEPLLSRVVPFETGKIPGGFARRDVIVTFKVALEEGEEEPPVSHSLDITIRVNRR